MPGIRDLILTICTLSFAYALLPQVAYGFREKLGTVTVQTASITAIGLYGIAGVYFSLALWFAGGACSFTGTLWVVLLLQRLRYGPPRSNATDDSP